MLKRQLTRIRHWIVRLLGVNFGSDCKLALWNSFDPLVTQCATLACTKVATDPSFKVYKCSSLGRNILRDEAAEWSKLYLSEYGFTYRDSDVHLACELYYHLFLRSDNND